ncbi:FAD-dependent oxidoreductase [Candidatus Nomurabacteria bacterium]|nr:FAD-dependent oxidoreductase [Candidatus Nomurabacteria bacterium]
MEKIFELMILGGGPAGCGAAVYAARKRLDTILITPEFGGQSAVSETIYNWIGTPEIGGQTLADNLAAHAKYYEGDILKIVSGQKVIKLSKDPETGIFIATTENGHTYHAHAVLITTGSGRRKLEAINADVFEHKGITYCASCDGPLFSDMDVVVIGGGNAGFESAAQLLAYAKSVTLLHKSEQFRADEITVEKVLKNPHMKAIKSVEILRVDGEKFVSSLTYRDKTTNEEITLPTQGIFVEIGQTPNTEFAKDVVSLDSYHKIPVDPRTQKTAVQGVWAAGDCTDGLYHQNNIATGDAVKAIEDIYQELKAR